MRKLGNIYYLLIYGYIWIYILRIIVSKKKKKFADLVSNIHTKKKKINKHNWITKKGHKKQLKRPPEIYSFIQKKHYKEKYFRIAPKNAKNENRIFFW